MTQPAHASITTGEFARCTCGMDGTSDEVKDHVLRMKTLAHNEFTDYHKIEPALPQSLMTELERRLSVDNEVLEAKVKFLVSRVEWNAGEVDRLTFLHKQDHVLADRYQEHREVAEREVQRLQAELQQAKAVVEAAKKYVAWWDEPQASRMSEAWQRKINALQAALAALDTIEPYRDVLHRHPQDEVE